MADVQTWNLRAKQYAAEPAKMVGWAGHPFESHQQFIVRLLRGLLGRDKKILDVGCGYGRFADITIRRKAQWVGVDFSPEMQRLWRQQGALGTFVLADAKQPPAEVVRLGPYDLVLCVGANAVMGLSVDSFCEAYGAVIRKPGHIVVVGPYHTTIKHLLG